MRYSKVAGFIKQLRMELNMSQPELAKYFGVHPATISKWELGATPRAESFQKIRDIHEDPTILYRFYGKLAGETEFTEKEKIATDKERLRTQIELLQKEYRKLVVQEAVASDAMFTVSINHSLRELVYEYVQSKDITIVYYINELIKKHMDEETKQ
jgi:transcriptional regulator with XRE-family HTH domain